MFPIKQIIERNAVLGLEGMSSEDTTRIWSALAEELPGRADNLELIYLPRLAEALKSTGLK